MWRAAAFCAALAAPAAADTIQSAEFTEPTERYAHGILGDAIEWGALKITVDSGAGAQTYQFDLPKNQVFEDLAPRLWDITGDGAPEVAVILTDVDLGASLVFIGFKNGTLAPIAATPHIGQSNRWLAPLGVADFDGDGRVEVAYIDRPHLAKTLMVWEYDGTELRLEAEVGGLTNHRIGEGFISGGLRNCAGTTEIITANANWTRIMATTSNGKEFTSKDIAPFTGPASLRTALTCP